MCRAMSRTHAARLGALTLFCSLSLVQVGALAATPCQKYTQHDACIVSDPAITETSGLAASHQHPGVIWLHNDSGDIARLFAVEIASGEKLVELEVVGIDARDWEDVAIAPCSPQSSDTECLFIADIGNNNLDRTDLVIHRVQEPAQLGVPGTPLILTAVPLDSYPIAYPFVDPEREAPLIPDAEAFAIDRATHHAFIWTKEDSRARLMMLPDWSSTIGEPRPLVYLGELPHGLVTGADIGPHGDRFALRTYGPFYEFASEEVSAFLAEPIDATLPSFTVKKNVAGEFQGEAIAYAASRSADEASVIYTLAEGSGQTLSSFECVAPASGQPLDMGRDSGHDRGNEEMGQPGSMDDMAGEPPRQDMAAGIDMAPRAPDASEEGGCATSPSSPLRPIPGLVLLLLAGLMTGAFPLLERAPRRDAS